MLLGTALSVAVRMDTGDLPGGEWVDDECTGDDAVRKGI